MTTKKVQPVERRKLNNTHRLMIVNHGIRKLVDLDLRAAEKSAIDALIGQFKNNARAIPNREIEVLTKYGRTRAIDEILLASRRKFATGTKSFEKPDGSVVERAEFEEVWLYKGLEEPLQFSTWDGVERIILQGHHYYHGRGEHFSSIYTDLAMRLGRSLTLPYSPNLTHGSRGTAFYFAAGDHDDKGGMGAWVTDETIAAVEAVYKASQARFRAELKLHKALVKLVEGAANYGVVLSLWPEAAEIELDLFGEKPLTNTALSLLNDEDRALLCNHMGKRGVTSSVCAIATSPAYAEQVAA